MNVNFKNETFKFNGKINKAEITELILQNSLENAQIKGEI